MDKILEEFEEFYKSQPFYDLKTDYEMASALGIYHLELKGFLKKALTKQKKELLEKLDKLIDTNLDADKTDINQVMWLQAKEAYNIGVKDAKNIINETK